MRCRACATELRANARFCDACGAEAGRGTRSASQATRDYTPRHLAQQVLTQRAAREGEHKQVTVLFVDVKGSLGLAESLELEAWHAIMDRFFAIAAEVVHRFEGTINQFTGDGVMVLFGAPIAHEDHAQRACLAALELRDELQRYADGLLRAFGVSFRVRMGINSGAVVVGRIGDDARMDYTAQGHAVGLASRMEQLAVAGSIYLTDRTAKLVQGFFRLCDLGELEVKGVDEPVRTHRLEGRGPARTRLDASRERGLTPFVGRAAQLAALEAALQEAERGHGTVFGVSAEAGVGKSRLCFEFARRCRERGIPVRIAHAVAHGRMVPFLPLLELLRDFFGIGERLDAAEARQRIAGAVLLLDPDLTPNLPLLFEFLGVPDASVPVTQLDPEARLRKLTDSVTALVRAGSRKEPLVFLFEDVHWIDPASEVFLERLVEIAAHTRILVLLNFRPGYHADWMRGPGYQAQILEPLGDADMAQLLDQLLGSDPANEALRRTIGERTAGNPFFVEEVVQSLLEAGYLEPATQGWRLAQPLERLEVPASLQAVIGARIDRLGEIEKLVLQTAAVIGKRFPEQLVRRVVGVSEESFAAALRALVSGGFIHEHSPAPHAEYAFRHPLTLEVAYGAQLAKPRARIHAAVARALEELHPERIGEIAALLAHHAQAAGHGLDAARWHRRAAEWAGVRDVRTAHRHWRKVMALAADEPDSPEKNQLVVQARVWIQQIAWRLGFSKEDTARNFSEGVALAQQCRDDTAVVMLAIGYAVYRGVIGDEEGQYRFSSEAASVADGMRNLPLALAARAVMASSLHFQGRLHAALEVADWAVAHRPEDPAGETAQFWISPYTYILGLRGLLRSLTGRFAAGADDLARALELAREIGDAEALGCVHGFSVAHARCSGDAAAALSHARQMTEVAQRTGIPLLLVDGQLALGSALTQSQRWDQAVAAFERALDIAEGRRILLGQRRRALSGLAQAYLGRGEYERAGLLAEELLAAPGSARTLLVELDAQLVLAHALLREEGNGARSAVHHAIAQAVDLVEKSGAASFEPLLHRTLAELAQRDGDEATRMRHLREAERLSREMASKGGRS